MMLHGEQGITLHREIPVDGELESTSTITGIWDKTKGAVVDTESTSVLAGTDEPLFTTRASLFFRGEGGWGGDRGPSVTVDIPDGAPDEEIAYSTRTDQALLYRLNGDRNPLHSDPQFAADGGFPKPILHGLCTYGFTGRALLHGLCDGDPAAFGSMDARFTSPVMPGETLTVRMWRTDDGAVFRTHGSDDSGRSRRWSLHAGLTIPDPGPLPIALGGEPFRPEERTDPTRSAPSSGGGERRSPQRRVPGPNRRRG